MTNNIQCSIESSTTKIELNSATEGVFLVPELEGLAGLPEIRTTSGVNAGYDGGWTSAQNYDARLITIRGVIANPDVSQVEAKRRAIASLLGQGRKEQLTLRITTEAGNSYAISVRTISCEMALQRVLTTQEFLIQLRADDPLIYDDGASAGTEAILYVQQALGGFEINFGLPLAIGGGAEDTVVQNGEETVYPILKLYGPLHRPTVVNTTTNQQMQLDADLQYTINWSGYETESGDYITISDAIEDAPLTLTQLSGNATQQTYSGKNLIDFDTATLYTSASVDSTRQGNGFKSTIQASTSSTALATYYNSSVTMPAGTYTVSFEARCQNSSSLLLNTQGYIIGQRGDLKDASGASASEAYRMLNSTWKKFSFTITTTAAQTFGAPNALHLYFLAPSGSQVFELQNPMLEAGSSATEYEPYVGGTASPNPDYPQEVKTVTGEQTVGVVGKNLISNISLAGGNSIILFNINKNVVQKSTNYIFSTVLDKDVSYNTVSLVLDGNSAGNFGTVTGTAGTTITCPIAFTDAQIEQTRNATTAAIRIYKSGAGFGLPSWAQLELGSTATTYEPYQGQSYTINLGSNELCKIGDYQDRIYKDDGKWYVEKQVGKVVFDGSENWTSSGGYFQLDNSFGSLPFDGNPATNALCDYFICRPRWHVASSTNYNLSINMSGSLTAIRYDAITDLATFQTWLSTHPTTVYYALATPTDTEITDDTLLSQLNFIASLYGGVNNISLVPSAGAQGEMEVSYATEYTIDQDVAIIDSQARTITINGQDAYHLKTAESEFLLLAPGENKLYLTSEASDDSGYAEVKFKQGYLSI